MYPYLIILDLLALFALLVAAFATPEGCEDASGFHHLSRPADGPATATSDRRNLSATRDARYARQAAPAINGSRDGATKEPTAPTSGGENSR